MHRSAATRAKSSSKYRRLKYGETLSLDISLPTETLVPHSYPVGLCRISTSADTTKRWESTCDTGRNAKIYAEIVNFQIKIDANLRYNVRKSTSFFWDLK